MNKYFIVFALVAFPFAMQAQTKKQLIKATNNIKVDDAVIRTNNKDTLYFEIDNSIILTPKDGKKVEYYITTTSGEIFKLSTNFYQVGNIKDNNVTITAFDKTTNKQIETKKFVVAKQVLPF